MSSFEGFETLSAYTRAQALADGILIAVPPMVSAVCGFKVPIAITTRAWEAVIARSTLDLDAAEAARRLAKLLGFAMMEYRMAAHRARVGLGPSVEDRLAFTADLPMGDGTMEFVELWIVIAPGDDTAPVGTIVMTDED